MSTHPTMPNNLTDLSAMVTNNITPQLRMCKNVLYYSQSIIGDYKYCARNDDHLGWLVCDGRLLDRVDFRALFEIVGTAFGSTNSANFRLPDFRGRVLGGVNLSSNRNNSFSARSLGSAVGAETHTLTIDEMPAHNHGVTDPGHTHTYVNNVNDQNTDNAFSTENAADNADLSQTTGSSTTGITINNTGGGLAHNNMQPTIFAGNVYVFAGVPGPVPTSNLD
jgi:microcystin-dependent protein